jgi:uncharacterized protein YegP (UPF0339 family)
MGVVKFEVKMGVEGKYQFKIFGKTGLPVVVSPGFQHKDSCMEAVRAVKANCKVQSGYTKRTLNDGKHEFVLKAPNHKIVVTGGPYDTVQLCDEAIAAVKDADQAAVIDRSQ